jgi:hypothetical protein
VKFSGIITCGSWIMDLRKVSFIINEAVAKGPAWLALAYLRSLSLIARTINKPRISRLMQNRIFGPKWPSLEFAPRKVMLGSQPTVVLQPQALSETANY